MPSSRREFISVFDMFKVGVGPSSSHTLGPWRASHAFLQSLKNQHLLERVRHIRIQLYGSLSLTGKGHATDLAVQMGLSGFDPVHLSPQDIPTTIETIQRTQHLVLDQQVSVSFSPENDLLFKNEFLSFHPNGLMFTVRLDSGECVSDTFYSIGGGFIAQEETASSETKCPVAIPYPIENAQELLHHCHTHQRSIAEVVYANETARMEERNLYAGLDHLWSVMLESLYRGCHSEGILPGGLSVRRRAFDIHQKLIGQASSSYHDPDTWKAYIASIKGKHKDLFKWVSCFALSVNEVNADMGRIVTAPTNGSAGVIPAVLMYYLTIDQPNADQSHIRRFLLVASEIGSIFKKGATISAAMGGCQAEIGVSSAMAAGALCDLLGGTTDQVLVAAEIAMEHHLGLTCDPVQGLVQIPCIERNAMGAIKAINAAELALETDPRRAKVPLDKVVATLWQTAQDMNIKYKETSQGGLAIAVSQSDC